MDPLDTCYCVRCRKPIPEEMSERRGICDACAAVDAAKQLPVSPAAAPGIWAVCPFCNTPSMPWSGNLRSRTLSTLSKVYTLLAFIAAVIYFAVAIIAPNKYWSSGYSVRRNQERLAVVTVCSIVLLIQKFGGGRRNVCPHCGNAFKPKPIGQGAANDPEAQVRALLDQAGVEPRGNTGKCGDATLQRPGDGPSTPGGDRRAAESERHLG